MKKIVLKSVVLGALAALVVLGGCDLVSRDFSRGADEIEDPTKGALVLLLDGGAVANRTIAPPNSFMTVSSYELEFTDPGGTVSWETVTGSAGLYSHYNLAAGPWTVAVSAYNTDDPDTGTLIGALEGNPAGVLSFTITSGLVLVESVDVAPIIGTGTLELEVSWPESAIESASVVASLTAAPFNTVNAPGDISSGISPVPPRPIFQISEASGDPLRRQASYAVTGLETGYYVLNLKLYDTPTGAGDPVLAWGWVESVRIVDFATSGQISEKNWPLDALSGGLELTTSASMQNPIEITLTPTPEGEITKSGGLIVEASPSGAGYEYQWYLDGVLRSDVENVVTGTDTYRIVFPSGSDLLTVGKHNLSVLVTYQSTLSSKTLEFTVAPNPEPEP